MLFKIELIIYFLKWFLKPTRTQILSLIFIAYISMLNFFIERFLKYGKLKYNKSDYILIFDMKYKYLLFVLLLILIYQSYNRIYFKKNLMSTKRNK